MILQYLARLDNYNSRHLYILLKVSRFARLGCKLSPWEGNHGYMDQISIKTPNPKCRLFLKIDQLGYLAAGVYLSEVPDPPPPLHTGTALIHVPLYLFTQGRGRGVM